MGNKDFLSLKPGDKVRIHENYVNVEEWLKNLKVGDKVALNGSYNNLLIRVVSRITKTLIILDTGGRFKRDTGYVVGGNIWSSALITPVTDEIISKIRTSNLKYKISRIDFETLSNDKLERILTIVNESENGK
jgi:hypothetical protein